MFNKLKEYIDRNHLRTLVRDHTEVNKRINQIEALYKPCTYEQIKSDGLHYKMYLKLVEKAYTYTVEEANLMLRLGMYDAYRHHCGIIDQLNLEIWKLKAA